MRAIKTKYLGPTDTKGARIKADDGAGNSITINLDYSCSIHMAHRQALDALVRKMGWKTPEHDYVSGWYGNDLYWVKRQHDGTIG